MEGENRRVTDGSRGSNTSSIPLPPSHGNFSSGKPFNNIGSRSSVKGVASVETEPKTEKQQVPAPQGHRDRDTNIDPKRLRRILASRQYSQKYRFKQLQYIVQLETEVKALQAEVAIKSPRIKYSDRQNSLLRAENNSMKQKLSTFSGALMFKEAEFQELKKERDMLKQFFEVTHKQQQLPELLKAKPGNHQFPNMGLMNQSEVNDDYMGDGIPQMVNQNSNRFESAEFVKYMNSLNLEPSYNFM